MQTLATRLLVDNVAAIRAARGAARRTTGLLDALAAILADGALEPAFVALVLTLPGEADIAREIGRDVDPDAIFAARAALRAAIGDASRGRRCATTTGASRRRGPYRPDAASAGRRALRNACLDLLVAARRARRDRARRRGNIEAADNMTDRMAALTTLSLLRRAASARPRSTISTPLCATIR